MSKRKSRVGALVAVAAIAGAMATEARAADKPLTGEATLTGTQALPKVTSLPQYTEGGFSGLFPVAGEPNTYWTVSDRGPNGDTFGTPVKRPFVSPAFAPSIYKIRADLTSKQLTILQRIPLKLPTGSVDPLRATVGGTPEHITGFGNSGVNAGANVPVADEAPVTDSNGDGKIDDTDAVLPLDPYGLDTEGIVYDARSGGSFWLVEEYRPSIVHVALDGTLLQRYTPAGQNAANLGAAWNAVPLKDVLPGVYSQRRDNRGFEGVAIAPDGKTLYAVMQNPLALPAGACSATTGYAGGNNSRSATRIAKLDITDPANPVFTGDFLYTLDVAAGTEAAFTDLRISDLYWVGTDRLLVDERDDTTLTRRNIYEANLSTATNLKTLDATALNCLDTLKPSAVAARGVKAAVKTPALDLASTSASAAYPYDKLEGVVRLANGTIVTVNDNDFQVATNPDGTYAVAAARTTKLLQYATPTASATAIGPNTSIGSYVLPEPGVNGVEITSLLTVNDPTTNAGNGYRMVGIPDGLGAYVSGGNLVVTANHELAADKGIVRAHGQKGAFVSKFTIDPATGAVLTGADAITSVKYWNYQTGTYGASAGNVPGTATGFGEAFKRFCSGFLATPAKLFNAATGNGFNGNLHLAGEETGTEGRLFATDPATGEAFQLPRGGLYSWENSTFATTGNDTTFFIGSTDATPGYLGSYIGTKTAAGTQVDKAGLTNGKPYALKALKPGGGFYTTEFEMRQAIATGTPVRFEWVEIDWNKSGAAQAAEAKADGALAMVRIEDSAWDPSSPRDAYFVTTERPTQADQTKTDSAGGLWRMRLDDAANPAAGGTLTLLLDGNETTKMNKPDNIDIDTNGHLLIQEDPGNVAYLAGIYAYRISDGQLKRIATFDPAQFSAAGKQDEESSGIIDVSASMGAGTFLFDVQAHNTVGLPTGTGAGTVEELVENGQLNKMRVDWAQVFSPATHKLVPVAPVRILDTRATSAVNYTGAKPAAGSTTEVTVAGLGGIPTSGAAAVVLNLTGIDATAAGYATVYPSGQPRPATSSINLHSAGATIANQVTVPLGANGKVSIFSETGSHFAIDVAGYYTAVASAPDGRLQMLTPTRLLDTRAASAVGYTGDKPAAGAKVDVKVAGAAGVPATGTTAVVVNLTTTETASAGYFTVFPKAGTMPVVSSLNVNGADETAANQVTVPLGADGSITVFTERGAHLLVDVVGYYTGSTATDNASGLFVPRSLFRLLDTRQGTVKPGVDATTDADLLIPVNAAAAVANVTVTGNEAAGFATVYKAGSARPGTSTVNTFRADQNAANAAIVQASAGKVSVFTETGTHLILDVVGYITA